VFQIIVERSAEKDLKRIASEVRPKLAGEGDVNWFLAAAPGGFAENLSLSPRSGSLEESGFLPEPGPFGSAHNS
jgi:hypothetical protein